MKLFVTGVGGQLGHDVVNEAISRGHQAWGSDIAAGYSGVNDGTAVVTAPYVPLDITDREAVQAVIDGIRPDAIIHCAAWTAVDAAEEAENRAKVRAINADGTGYIAEAAKRVDAKMVYISTDYVFDGRGERPWEPDDQPDPLNVYGLSKFLGEEAVRHYVPEHFIVRISWLFGINGKNFVRTMLRLGAEREQITVVDSLEEAAGWLREHTGAGDTVLFENDLPDNY